LCAARHGSHGSYLRGLRESPCSLSPHAFPTLCSGWQEYQAYQLVSSAKLAAITQERDAELSKQASQVEELQVRLPLSLPLNQEPALFARIFQAQLASRDATISEHDAELAKHAEQVQRQEATIAEQKAKIAEQKDQISNDAAKIMEQGSKIAEQESAIKQFDPTVKPSALRKQIAEQAETIKVSPMSHWPWFVAA
jgi:hypothetical protein